MVMVMKPMLLVNFKAYKNGTGKKALNLANIIEEVAIETNSNICIAVESSSIYIITRIITIPVFAQHIDCVDFGPYTGHVLAESIKEYGAYGTLLNHSERNIAKDKSEAYLKKCNNVGLKSVLCVSGLDEMKVAAKLNPDYIAFEDPTLIGSGKSISKMKPDLLKRFVDELTETNRHVIPLCGAGISDRNDIEIALKLGAEGVLVSSSIVNSNSPSEVLRDMASALNGW
ncbi:MAG: triose-phosphate isomerase [Candidatus Aenigmarchaeota archaeon]|nr:triose-phosphate isomerase [Candidatus Aenigmarchaeota archaeon]